LPIAPGVVAGTFDESLYQFKNYRYQEVYSDLVELLDKLKQVNPQCKVLLTVSPVPLAATYEPRHVCVLSMASKSVLRVVVEQVTAECEHVDYFPSYEIFSPLVPVKVISITMPATFYLPVSLMPCACLVIIMQGDDII